MGRHSNGTKNYRLAGWMWMTIIAIIAVVALIFGWNALRSDNQADNAQQACTEGDYSLKVWAAEKHAQLAEELVKDYNDSKPVVRDACVTADIDQVSDSDVLRDLKDKKSDAAAVWIPDNPQQAAKGLREADVQLSSQQVPVVDGAPIFALGSAAVSDEQAARAGSDFSSFSADREGTDVVAVSAIEEGSVSPDASANDTTATPESSTNGTPDDAQREGAGRDGSSDAPGEKPMDVTFVLDTSGSMGLVEGNLTRLDNIRGPLADSMRAVGRDGGKVGLWNYSSPISGAVTLPYRANVDVNMGDDGSVATSILNQLNYGGATHTYESILAAYSSAVTGAEQSESKSFRVVLITDGPNDGGRQSLESAAAMISELHSQTPVQLDIVSIGENVDTAALEQLAGAAGGKIHQARDSLDFAGPLAEALK